jgi:rRNA-processing protein FCF1
MYLLLKKQADIMKGLMDIFNSHSSQRNRDIRILDSSVIIDGRAADIISSGFMPGKILIPRFVLMELQLIADSSNSLKRNKGRRGLDIVDRLIKDFPSDVSVYYGDIETVKDVDEKLVELCKFLNATLVTPDLNVNKVAKIQGIPVMNVNELSNAVKPMFIPGDQITINIVKDGKEPKQGIGYLNDGTMVIVENGRVYIGKTVSVIVNSVMQTSAGRLVFSNVDFEVTAENPPESNSPESNTGESNIEVNIESDTEIRSKSINESINKPNNESNLDIKTNHNYNGNDFNVKKYNGNKYKGTEKKEKNLKEKNLAEGVNNEYSGPNINKKTKKKRGCKK